MSGINRLATVGWSSKQKRTFLYKSITIFRNRHIILSDTAVTLLVRGQLVSHSKLASITVDIFANIKEHNHLEITIHLAKARSLLVFKAIKSVSN